MTQPNPQAEAYASLWMEECQRHAEARIRFVAFAHQNRELTARAETAEARVAELSTPTAPPNVVDLHPDPDELSKTA